MPAEELLAAIPETAWREVNWRRGTKGPLRARLAAVRVRVAGAPTKSRNGHLSGEEVWLVGEHRSTGKKKYNLSTYGGAAPLQELARGIEARWVCEQAQQQMQGRTMGSITSWDAAGAACTTTRW